MGLPTKAGKSGAARAYISRKKAMQKLNLSLKEFRRLCILKGVYPVEPRKKSKLNPGNQMKTYYSLSDIQYLSHEPIIWKFWEFKIFMRRMKRAKAFKDGPRIESMMENKPFYKLDHVVRERYPTFIDALRDLDDGLSMCFLYSRFSKSLNFPHDLIEMSRRLTVEFMHWIIDARALRKVFVSIKGYYYQAEIMGQVVTWIVPHPFVVPKMADIDAKVIRSFTEFYIHLLGFVNFRLYKQNNISYPPKVSMDQVNQASAEALDEESLKRELFYGLNRSLVKNNKGEEDQKVDTFEDVDESEESEAKSAFGLTYRQTVKLQSLFDGCKFFLNREVPQEPLALMIRSFGGEVSWYSTQHPGATYDESNDRITHQIVDKEVPDKRLDRVYVQPQWIFDSINAKQLLNCQEYFPGVTLPPHLSPFTEEEESNELHYVTPDVARLKGEEVKPIEVTEEAQDAMEKAKENKKRKKKSPAHGSGEKKAKSITQSKVVTGQATKPDKPKEQSQTESEEKKLAIMMIPKKQKKLYDKVIKLKKDKMKKVAKLTAKRVHWEDEQRTKKIYK